MGGSVAYKPEPGMRSNLEIDWSNQSDEYSHLIGNYATVKKEILETASLKLQFDSDEDSIEIMKVKPGKSSKYNRMIVENHNKKYPALDFLELKKKGEEPTVKQESSVSSSGSTAVNKMHSRVIKKARSKLTHAIKKTLENNSDEFKNVARSLKNTVLKIEDSVNQNRHLDIIKSVTSDGTDLEHSAIETLDSTDVLDRVKLFHDLED